MLQKQFNIFRKFPILLILNFISTIIIILNTHDVIPTNIAIPLIISLITCSFGTLTICALVERFQWPWIIHGISLAILTGLITNTVYLKSFSILCFNSILLSLGFILLAIAVPFMNEPDNTSYSFSQFNKLIIFNFLQTTFFSLLIFIIICILFASFSYLFDITIPFAIYQDSGFIIGLGIAPWFMLQKFSPKQKTENRKQKTENRFFRCSCFLCISTYNFNLWFNFVWLFYKNRISLEIT